MVAVGDLETSERSAFFSAAEFVDERREKDEKVLQNNSNALNVKFFGELGDQKPHTGDNRCETKNEAGEQPDLDTVARAKPAFICGSAVEHFVAYSVDHDQADCAEDPTDVVAEIRHIFLFGSRCNSNDKPPRTKELKRMKDEKIKCDESLGKKFHGPRLMTQ